MQKTTTIPGETQATTALKQLLDKMVLARQLSSIDAEALSREQTGGTHSGPDRGRCAALARQGV